MGAQPLDITRNTSFKWGARFVPKESAGFRNIGTGHRDVAGLWWRFANDGLGTHSMLDGSNEVV